MEKMFNFFPDRFAKEYHLFKYEQTGNPAFLWCIIQMCIENKESFPPSILEYLHNVSKTLLKEDSENSKDFIPIIEEALQIQGKKKLQEPIKINKLFKNRNKLLKCMQENNISQNAAIVEVYGYDNRHCINDKKKVEQEEEIYLDKVIYPALDDAGNKAAEAVQNFLGSLARASNVVLAAVNEQKENGYDVRIPAEEIQPTLARAAKRAFSKLDKQKQIMAEYAGSTPENIVLSLQQANIKVSPSNFAKECLRLIDEKIKNEI